MKALKIRIVITLLVSGVLAACTSAAPTTTPTQAPPNPPAGNPTSGSDPQNSTYIIEGQPVTLVNGVAQMTAARGSASKQVTRYFGNAAELDLNGYGLADSAFLLTQEGGGSGTFFYAAAALQTANGYQGTNTILLGDRIAPQSTIVDPNNPAQFIVNFADRKPDEPMSASASVAVSKIFKYENDALLEVLAAPK